MYYIAETTCVATDAIFKCPRLTTAGVVGVVVVVVVNVREKRLDYGVALCARRGGAPPFYNLYSSTGTAA